MRQLPIDTSVPIDGTQTVGQAFCSTSPKRMNHKSVGLTALALALLTLSSQAQTESPDLDSEIYEMSPFTVETTSDVGYLATSSLAGTRINSELKDLGAAISVVTQEFLADTASTNMEDLLVYTTGTEVGGTSGNFTNSGTQGGRANQEANRAYPEGNTRVRGLVRAEVSRDYFMTDFGFDSYNVERVDISRGPNSVLFGVGSPGGVINYSSKQAKLQSNIHKIGIRFDQRGSLRTTLDINRAIIPDRFAVRFNALSDRTKYRQEPAFEDDDRYALALQGVLFEGDERGIVGRTTVKASFEQAKVKTAPPNVIAPIDTIRYWYNVPDVEAITSQTGTTAPSRYTDGSFVSQAMHDTFGSNDPFMGSLAQRLPWFNQVGLVYSDATLGFGPSIGHADPESSALHAAEGRITGTFDWEMQNSIVDESWTTGFAARSLSDTSIYNWVDTLLTGRLETREDDFDNVTVSVEQLFWKNRAGFELSYNSQHRDRRSQFPFGVGEEYGIIDGRATDIKLDNNLWLGNGESNPNAGRPLLVSRNWGNHSEEERDRETTRLTAFMDIDFAELIDAEWGHWLGHYKVSGLVEESSYFRQIRGYGMAVSSDELDLSAALGGNYYNFARQLHGAFYIGPDLRGVDNYEDVRFDGYIDVAYPKNGDKFNTFVYDPDTGELRTITAYTEEFLKAGYSQERIIQTTAFTIQGYLLEDYLVGMFGYREDHVEDTPSVTLHRFENGKLDPASLDLADEPNLDTTGNTISWSVVAHYPDRWLPDLPQGMDISLFYSNSENFTPVGFRQDVYLNSLEPPSGHTEEHGFLISLMENKVNLRVNWYKTENTNIALDTNLARLAMSPVARSMGRLMAADNADVPFGYDYRGDPTGIAEYYSSYDEVYEVFLHQILPEPINSAADLTLNTNGAGRHTMSSKTVNGLTSSSDLVAEGMEIELVANPLPNWTLMFNAAKQETIQSGTGAELGTYYDTIRTNLINAHLWDVRDAPNEGTDFTYKTRVIGDFLNPLAAITAKDGTLSAEQRKWRFNFSTAYRITEIDWLKDVTVGGSFRWQDKAAAGYPIILIQSEAGDTLQKPDLEHPWYSPSQWNGDLFIRYKTRLFDVVDWTIQFNARNVLGDDDIRAEVINPDGTPAIYRAPVEKTFILSNTFSF